MTNQAAPEPHASEAGLSFPRLQARTARFTLGEPRNLTVTPDGSTVLFVRTRSGVDRTGVLWAFDVVTGLERMLADPAVLLGDNGEQLSGAERSRRERARESGAGIVGYAIDNAGATAVFALSGGLWTCDIATGRCGALPVAAPVIDPRIDPTGRRVAYASNGALRVIDVVEAAAGEADADTVSDAADSHDRELVGPDRRDSTEAEVVWGQAEFVAAEEMDRFRGFWWAPDGESLLVERYDNAPIGLWYIADPAHPEREPAAHRYPAAGTANADVTLWHITLSGERRQVPCTDAEFPYLARVSWNSAGPVVQVLSRDQRRSRILAPDLRTAADYAADQTLYPTCRLLEETSDSAWIDLVTGLPTLAPEGRLLTSGIDRDTDTHRLLLGGRPLTPPGMQLRAVLDVTEHGVLATVSTDPAEQQLVWAGYDATILAMSTGPGVHAGASGGDTLVIASSSLQSTSAQFAVCRVQATVRRPVGALASHVMPAPFLPQVEMLTVGERGIKAALVLPQGHQPGSAKLPVVMAPYGGPHAQLVRASGRMFLQAQWLADQGFAVIVADGRGTPARGPAWERSVRDELASVTLQDQVDALGAVAAAYPNDLDTSRVGIMGWSYGGYLAALAVLDRPDVFHAAVAGAPVTDWTLYDTCYTERYLGDPNSHPEVYVRNGLIERAPQLTRPLLLIHGLADDNVVVAHTLRLSGALLAAGRPHEVLPLTGITHMASDEVVAENILLAQVAFFRRALG